MTRDAEFQAFMAGESHALFRYACLLTGSRTLGQDLAQEAMVRLWQNRRRVEPAAWRVWVRRCIHNQNISWWRKVSRREEPLPAAGSRTDPVVGDGAQRRADHAALVDAVRALPTKTRTAIVLYYFEDWPTSEIATILDSSESAVRVLLSRGRVTLRTTLTPADELQELTR